MDRETQRERSINRQTDRRILLSRKRTRHSTQIANVINQPENEQAQGWCLRLQAGHPGAGIMEADDRQVTTVFTVQPSFHHRHSANRVSWSVTIVVQSQLTSSFANDGNASWYWVCRVPMVEWRLDCEDCRHLTVVGLHDTGPRCTSLSACQTRR